MAGDGNQRHYRRAHTRVAEGMERRSDQDRKSTRLNSSHVKISYAVFCLKKNKNSITDAIGKIDGCIFTQNITHVWLHQQKFINNVIEKNKTAMHTIAPGEPDLQDLEELF